MRSSLNKDIIIILLLLFARSYNYFIIYPLCLFLQHFTRRTPNIWRYVSNLDVISGRCDRIGSILLKDVW